jgi:hypothetical protein
MFFQHLLLLNSTYSFAQTCGAHCTPLVTSLSEKSDRLERTQVILKKNEEYLKKNPNASASISVKVRSNILVSKLQIETFQNEKILIEKTIQEKGCNQCKTQRTNAI